MRGFTKNDAPKLARGQTTVIHNSFVHLAQNFACTPLPFTSYVICEWPHRTWKFRNKDHLPPSTFFNTLSLNIQISTPINFGIKTTVPFSNTLILKIQISTPINFGINATLPSLLPLMHEWYPPPSKRTSHDTENFPQDTFHETVEIKTCREKSDFPPLFQIHRSRWICKLYDF